MLTLYNDLTNKKEVFEPLDPPRVTMYNCGPTVYHYAHIGNLRSFVFADTLRRALESNGYTVDQVINITDVGHLTGDTNDTGADKIEAQAKRENKTAEEIAQFYTDAFLCDLDHLGIDRNTIRFPMATAHIDQQIELIEQLEKKGVTYATDDGIYFDTSAAENYPKLGTIQASGLQAGARVEENKQKRQPADFALWKFSKTKTQQSEKRLQEWNSPWGVGFPGWHLECSAMAIQYLGETIDIHTGGIDLEFPHHANEIAQSECATGKPFARYWLHSEHLNLKGAKMAKSDGNIITLQDLIQDGIHPLSYRYWLLTAHYRSPITFDPEAVLGTQRALERLKTQLDQLPQKDTEGNTKTDTVVPEAYLIKITEAINDDLDTPTLTALIWETLKDTELTGIAERYTVEYILDLLGIDLADFSGRESIGITELPPEVAELAQERENARASKDFDRADKLRADIKQAGYEIHDTETGPEFTHV
ncbi:MAG: cysteine--tRNA ligase [Candidatus Paceibacterota bacterium]